MLVNKSEEMKKKKKKKSYPGRMAGKRSYWVGMSEMVDNVVGNCCNCCCCSRPSDNPSDDSCCCETSKE